MATMAQAVRLALHYGETHLGVTDVFGEDVGPPLGGVFTCTQGLKTAWNTPIDERGIVGAAMGIALAGGRPVFEIQFADYALNAIDLLKVAGNQRWSSAGLFDMPIVMMTPSGAGIHGSVYHSHSFESWATRMPGWKVVCPSRPIDAYGLMLAAIIDPNPVMVLLPKALLRIAGDELIPGEPESAEELHRRIDAPVGDERDAWVPDWPEVREYIMPIGSSRIARAGDAATVVAYGRQLPVCVEAANRVRERTGKSAEVIDLCSIFPYDWPQVRESIGRTGRLLVVNEDSEITNFGEHLLRRAIDDAFYELECRPRGLFADAVPGVGLHPNYESDTIPQADAVERAIYELVTEAA